MPLRDHFRPPVSRLVSWEEIHGQWPARFVMHLKTVLPPGYVSGPLAHSGGFFEVDIAAFERDEPLNGWTDSDSGGGVATATWTKTTPNVAVVTEIPDDDEYEVRVYDATRERTLVAVIELVSPANKDRREQRNRFVSKCAAFLKQGIGVSIVDVVSIRSANLYVELLDFMGQSDPSMGKTPPATYAATCRWLIGDRRGKLETWSHTLTIGQPLPTIPLWLSPTLAIDLDLNVSYENALGDLGVK